MKVGGYKGEERSACGETSCERVSGAESRERGKMRKGKEEGKKCEDG